VSNPRTSPERDGLLIVLAGPSGTGKSTILKEVFARDPRLAFSVSCTTRAPRTGEVDGRDYYFISNETFDEMVATEAFAEWANVHTRRYGTPKTEIRRLFDAGRDIVFDIDTVGAKNLKRVYPDAVMVFILPPSLGSLESRLRGRKTETEEMLQIRLENARNEIAQANGFDYLVTNGSVSDASNALSAIITAERFKTKRLSDLPSRLLEGQDIP
jgi:guanylate kinase